MNKNSDRLEHKIVDEYSKLPSIIKSRGSNKGSERIYKLRQHIIHLSNISTASNMIDSKKLNTSGNTYAENILKKESRRLWQS